MKSNLKPPAHPPPFRPNPVTHIPPNTTQTPFHPTPSIKYPLANGPATPPIAIAQLSKQKLVARRSLRVRAYTSSATSENSVASGQSANCSVELPVTSSTHREILCASEGVVMSVRQNKEGRVVTRPKIATTRAPYRSQRMPEGGPKSVASAGQREMRPAAVEVQEKRDWV
ncbi:hypothetical protein HBI62_208210 [Parastagonospora nodorum]|nr:hypothetical protein HBI62_208210 [Parastagonospora nodorum]